MKKILSLLILLAGVSMPVIAGEKEDALQFFKRTAGRFCFGRGALTFSMVDLYGGLTFVVVFEVKTGRV